MTDSTFLVQTATSIAVAYGLQLLKQASWFPWLTEATLRRVKVAWGVLAAVASALAVQVAWNGDAGTLTVTGLTVENMAHGLVLFLTALGSQQAAYSILVKPATTTVPLSVNMAKVGTGLALILALSVGATGCAKKMVVVEADQGVLAVLAGIDASEMRLHEAKVVSDDAHGVFSNKFVRVLVLGRDFNRAVRDWPVGTPQPATLALTARSLMEALKDLLALFPPSAGMVEIRSYIDAALAIVTPLSTGA
jgi:hypothetical protein